MRTPIPWVIAQFMQSPTIETMGPTEEDGIWDELIEELEESQEDSEVILVKGVELTLKVRAYLPADMEEPDILQNLFESSLMLTTVPGLNYSRLVKLSESSIRAVSEELEMDLLEVDITGYSRPKASEQLYLTKY